MHDHFGGNHLPLPPTWLRHALITGRWVTLLTLIAAAIGAFSGLFIGGYTS